VLYGVVFVFFILPMLVAFDVLIFIIVNYNFWVGTLRDRDRAGSGVQVPAREFRRGLTPAQAPPSDDSRLVVS
jgi:hypothetical protein